MANKIVAFSLLTTILGLAFTEAATTTTASAPSPSEGIGNEGQRMIINGCTMNSRAYKPLSCNASWGKPVPLPVKPALTTIRPLFRPSEGLILRCATGISSSSHLSASSTPLLGGEHGGLSHTIPLLPKRRGCCLAPRASKDIPSSFRFPPMTKKPQWWWRTLACLPYLMPLHETWMYAQTAYHLHPFLEDFEFLTYPFLGAIGNLPPWFFMAYFFVAYLGIVRRKEWPHFFRFHVVTGMLLEIALQVVGTVSRWLPLGLYWGKIGMHFWGAAAFGYLFTVLECIRSALTGMYADVPFVCDAAYIQIPYE